MVVMVSGRLLSGLGKKCQASFASSHDVDHLVRAIKMLYLLILIDVPMYIVFSPHVRECVLTRWETSTDKVPKVSLPFLSSSAGKVPWCSIWL